MVKGNSMQTAEEAIKNLNTVYEIMFDYTVYSYTTEDGEKLKTNTEKQLKILIKKHGSKVSKALKGKTDES